MIQVSGTYDKGIITLDKEPKLSKPVKVMVSFADEDMVVKEKRLTINDFSFLKSRELLKDVRSNISGAVIEERGSAV